MLESWNLSRPDLGDVTVYLGQVIIVGVLSVGFLRQRRLHRLTLAQLDRLIAAARLRAATWPDLEPEAACEIIKLDERRT
jgi:hypothetical protein